MLQSQFIQVSLEIKTDNIKGGKAPGADKGLN